MEETILFSIIVPVYCTEKQLLEKCFQSIQNQTYQNYECLVIDDGNEESYAIYLERYLEQDYRFRVIHIEHKGNSYGRNIGIDEAVGDYLMFVDSDDMIYPNVLSEAYCIIEDVHPDMVLGLIKPYRNADDLLIEDKNNNKYEIKSLNGKKDIERYVNHILGYRSDEFYFENGSISGQPAAKVCKTSLAKNNKFPDGDIITEDVIWNMNILKDVTSMVISLNVWYAYFLHLGSKSRRFYLDGQKQFIEQVDMYWKTCKKNWPNCDKGLYIELWQEISIFFRIYLNHPENQESWKSKYLMFTKIFKMPEYKEVLRNIDFSFDHRRLKRVAKKALLFFIRFHIYLPAWIIWTKISDEHL